MSKKLSCYQFEKLISKTNMHWKTKNALSKVLVDGDSYISTGFTRQFIYKKIVRLKSIDKEYGYGIWMGAQAKTIQKGNA